MLRLILSCTYIIYGLERNVTGIEGCAAAFSHQRETWRRQTLNPIYYGFYLVIIHAYKMYCIYLFTVIWTYV